MILNDLEIIKKIEQNQLVDEYIDLKKQVTSNGFDFSVDKISKFQSSGKVDFSNKERIVSESKELEFENEIFLEQGFYKIKTKEKVNMSSDIVGILRTRSTLLRCGAFVATGVCDAGFKGKLEFLLVVGPQGITLKKNARIVQMVFFKINPVNVEYKGIYKNLD